MEGQRIGTVLHKGLELATTSVTSSQCEETTLTPQWKQGRPQTLAAGTASWMSTMHCFQRKHIHPHTLLLLLQTRNCRSSHDELTPLKHRLRQCVQYVLMREPGSRIS